MTRKKKAIQLKGPGEFAQSEFFLNERPVAVPHSCVYYARAYLMSNPEFVKANGGVEPSLAEIEAALYDLNMLPPGEKRKIEQRK